MLLHLLLALLVVVALGRVLGRALGVLGQPPVIGEVIAGILLGPSLLGLIAPAAYHYLLPVTVVPALEAVAQLGVVLYMFLVGLELNPDRLRGRLRGTTAIALAGIAVPFALGAALAVYLYPRLSTTAVPFVSFALFIGVAMSITAFPVLARILADRRMTHTELGGLALACAAIADVTAWCLLAFVVGIVNTNPGSALVVAILTIAFVLVMFVVVRPVVSSMVARVDQDAPSPAVIASVLVALLASAFFTEAIGVHAIFGAFLLGAVIPHDSRLASTIHERFDPLVTLLLLPAFFAFTGMRTQIGLLMTPLDWILCLAIIVIATAGKWGGTTAAARVTGLPWRQAVGLGVLMNTRGLMELIVLNVGLELGVISPRVFTMFVVMALVTTLATTPILKRITRRD